MAIVLSALCDCDHIAESRHGKGMYHYAGKIAPAALPPELA
jgi:hypothetical protein